MRRAGAHSQADSRSQAADSQVGSRSQAADNLTVDSQEWVHTPRAADSRVRIRRAVGSQGAVRIQRAATLAAVQG